MTTESPAETKDKIALEPNPIDLLKSQSAERPEDVSSAYLELEEVVSLRFGNLPNEIQHILFCIAYTEYTKRKKTRIARAALDGEDIDSRTVKSIHRDLCNQEEYLELCTRAFEKLDAVEASVSLQINRTIAGIVASEVKSEVRKIVPKHTIFNFIKNSTRHAFEIVIASFVLLAIYYALSAGLPTLQSTVDKYLGKIVTLFSSDSIP